MRHDGAPAVKTRSLVRRQKAKADPFAIQELGQCLEGDQCTVRTKRVVVTGYLNAGKQGYPAVVLVRLLVRGKEDNSRGPWALQADEPVRAVRRGR